MDVAVMKTNLQFEHIYTNTQRDWLDIAITHYSSSHSNRVHFHTGSCNECAVKKWIVLIWGRRVRTAVVLRSICDVWRKIQKAPIFYLKPCLILQLNPFYEKWWHNRHRKRNFYYLTKTCSVFCQMIESMQFTFWIGSRVSVSVSVLIKPDIWNRKEKFVNLFYPFRLRCFGRFAPFPIRVHKI